MGSPQPDVTALLAALTSELDRRGIRFMLIGGQAVLLHGQSRFTADVDVTLDAGPAAFGELRAACEALDLTPVAPVSETFEAFVRRKGASLDWLYLERWAAEFALVPGREGMPAALERLKALRK